MQQKPQLSAVEEMAIKYNIPLADLESLLATALEEQKMKTEVGTGLKNFQVTMEEIAKAKIAERQRAAKIVESWMEDEEHWQPIVNDILNGENL